MLHVECKGRHISSDAWCGGLESWRRPSRLPHISIPCKFLELYTLLQTVCTLACLGTSILGDGLSSKYKSKSRPEKRTYDLPHNIPGTAVVTTLLRIVETPYNAMLTFNGIPPSVASAWTVILVTDCPVILLHSTVRLCNSMLPKIEKICTLHP